MKDISSNIIYIVVLQDGVETHLIGGRIRGAFPCGVVFIYTELPERPRVFGCVYRGGRGVTVGGVGGSGCCGGDGTGGGCDGE